MFASMFTSILPLALIALMLSGLSAFAYVQQRAVSLNRVRRNCARLPNEDSEF